MRNNSPGEAQQQPSEEYDEIAKMRQSLRDIHQKTRSWRFVGQAIGCSGAYARMIANGEREPSQDVIDRWRKYRKPPRKRKKYWRPCLPLWMRYEVKKGNWSDERIGREIRKLLVERTEKDP